MWADDQFVRIFFFTEFRTALLSKKKSSSRIHINCVYQKIYSARAFSRIDSKWRIQPYPKRASSRFCTENYFFDLGCAALFPSAHPKTGPESLPPMLSFVVIDPNCRFTQAASIVKQIFFLISRISCNIFFSAELIKNFIANLLLHVSRTHTAEINSFLECTKEESKEFSGQG